MVIEFTRGSKKKREYSENLCNFIADKFMPRMSDRIKVKIKFVTGLIDREFTYGDCIWEDQDYRPKEFTIRIDAGMSLRKTLLTVAHEMVHVKQFAKNELKQMCYLKAHRWQGQYVPEGTDYWDLPWEIEAHGREIGLFNQWISKEGLSTQKWTFE